MDGIYARLIPEQAAYQKMREENFSQSPQKTFQALLEDVKSEAAPIPDAVREQIALAKNWDEILCIHARSMAAPKTGGAS